MIRFFIFLFLSAGVAKATEISSNHVHYDGEKIILTGKVTVRHLMGVVTSERAELRRDLEGKSKIDFPWAELSCGVVATLTDGGKFTCDKVVSDYFKMTSHFTASEQIHYSDGLGELFADDAIVNFEEEKNRVYPTKITLTGHIKMIRQIPSLQYALADSVEYFPKEETLIFKGDKVLFFDKAKGLQLSANEVRAKRDGEKESVQGIGEVSFLFKEEELKKLQDQFQWEY